MIGEITVPRIYCYFHD